MPETTTFNPMQQHLLKMFSFVKTDQQLPDIKEVLFDFFFNKVGEDMDELWSKGEWNKEKNDALLNEHLRTPYTVR